MPRLPILIRVAFVAIGDDNQRLRKTFAATVPSETETGNCRRVPAARDDSPALPEAVRPDREKPMAGERRARRDRQARRRGWGKSGFGEVWAAIGEFWRCRRGAAAVMVAVAAVPLAGFIGIATDASRGYLMKSRMGEALDAAALAGGRALFSPNFGDDVDMFFTSNLPADYLGATITGPSVSVDASGEIITLTASAEVPTTFMRLFGHETMTVSARTVVHRAVRGMELVLVMDNTGSMSSGGKITAMKNAAKDLIDILYGNNETIPDFWVALVPYSASVNIGNGRSGWLTGYNPAAYGATAWKGCVEARDGALDRSDAPPAAGQYWRPYLYPSASDNVWPPINEAQSAGNNGTGPNLGCGPAITPLTPGKTAIKTAIDGMAAWSRGGTLTNLGLVWGWRTISPSWRGVWGGPTPAHLPLDYGTPLMDKVAIILTDGVNQFYDNPPAGPDGSDYTSYGRVGWGRLGTTSGSQATTEVNNRMAEVCESMKANGIIVYTITFQLTNTTTQDLFRACASSPDNYYNSPSNADLADAFREIGTELSQLRLAE